MPPPPLRDIETTNGSTTSSRSSSSRRGVRRLQPHGRMVEAQRREIGIGMALGRGTGRGSRTASPGGLPDRGAGRGVRHRVGSVIGALMADLLRGFFPLPVWALPVPAGVFLRGAALGLVLPSRRPSCRCGGPSVSPRWRRSAPARAARAGWPAVRRVPLPGRRSPAAVRNVLRAPRRTLTAFGIGAAITVLVGVVGMIDSFIATIDRGEEESVGDHQAVTSAWTSTDRQRGPGGHRVTVGGRRRAAAQGGSQPGDASRGLVPSPIRGRHLAPVGNRASWPPTGPAWCSPRRRPRTWAWTSATPSLRHPARGWSATSWSTRAAGHRHPPEPLPLPGVRGHGEAACSTSRVSPTRCGSARRRGPPKR